MGGLMGARWNMGGGMWWGWSLGMVSMGSNGGCGWGIYLCGKWKLMCGMGSTLSMMGGGGWI